MKGNVSYELSLWSLVVVISKRVSEDHWHVYMGLEFIRIEKRAFTEVTVEEEVTVLVTWQFWWRETS